MANDRDRTDDEYSGPSTGSQSEPGDERIRDGAGDDVRGVADEEDDEFDDDDMDDAEEDEENDGSF